MHEWEISKKQKQEGVRAQQHGIKSRYGFLEKA
jgi:hypothetical protein